MPSSNPKNLCQASQPATGLIALCLFEEVCLPSTLTTCPSVSHHPVFQRSSTLLRSISGVLEKAKFVWTCGYAESRFDSDARILWATLASEPASRRADRSCQNFAMSDWTAAKPQWTRLRSAMALALLDGFSAQKIQYEHEGV